MLKKVKRFLKNQSGNTDSNFKYVFKLSPIDLLFRYEYSWGILYNKDDRHPYNPLPQLLLNFAN